MDIKEFFEQSAGKWLSQRTSHSVDAAPAESGKSNIIIELLPANAPEVIKLCEKYAVEPQLALCGARVTWDGTIEPKNEKHQGSTLLVPVPDSDKPNQGQVLREISDAQKAPVAGRYSLGSDDVLTLITDSEAIYSEERWWFASPNLRMRTSILKQSGSYSKVSLYSEIRMGLTQAPKQTQDAATKA
jgi:hypothetical protein